MKKRLSPFLALALVLILVQSLAAHYVFMMPEKFRVAPGEAVKIGFHAADGFPDSTQAAKRLTDATVRVGAKPEGVALVGEEKRLSAVVTLKTAGHVVATVTNASTVGTMNAKSFTGYLREENLQHVIDARSAAGEADKSARERYTMFAKSILLSGKPDQSYAEPVGHTIEIIPEKDPYALKSGESLPVRVLVRGKPAASLEVMAASTGSFGGKSRSVGKTDAAGRIVIPLSTGAWRLHTIYMERSTNPDADWESFWATLTFEAP
jgi:uncharacterized GH25 family protein